VAPFPKNVKEDKSFKWFRTPSIRVFTVGMDSNLYFFRFGTERRICKM